MNAPQKKGFDLIAVTAQTLQYVRHARLMIAMGCIGILAGLVYYIYSTPLYQARSLVYVRGFGSPVRMSDVPETVEAGGINRNTVKEFTSRRNIVETAKRMGIVGPSATWEDVVYELPSVSSDPIDNAYMEVSVLARNPAVVRKFAEELVVEFQLQQELSWEQYRNEALTRYAREVQALETKADEGLKQLAAFERDGKMTESSIEQTRLNELPKDLVITREVLKRMDVVKSKLDSMPTGSYGDASIARTLEELSLLASFDKERDIKVGDMIRKPLAGSSSPVQAVPAPRLSTEIIVQPSMVESLLPWQQLEKDRRMIEDKISEAAKQYLPGHQVMKELNEQLETNDRALRTELDVVRQRFDLEHEHSRSKLALLEKRLPEYHKVNEELSQTTQTYAGIEKEKALWDKARDHIAEKLAVVTFSQDRNWVEMRYKGHTALRDEIPVSPNKMRLVILSALLAVGGAIGLPTIVNLANSSVHTLQQLEDATGIKGVGIVPHTTKELLEDVCRSNSIGAKTPNYLLENFRLVRSHILLHPGRNGRSQAVMCTSARPSEGKTSQAANLAWAFQSMGARTILIDCDLRRGRVHGVTSVSNKVGLTSLLLGQCTLDACIQKTSLPMLDVIPRGHISIGTTDILVQPIFAKLMEVLRSQYDQIILDAPPVLGLSETSSLQNVVDGVIFVVRAEVTSRKDVVDAVTILRKAGAHMFGIVLNDLDLAKVSNYYNYYYYSAAYYDDLEVPSDEDEAPLAIGPNGRGSAAG
jgi:succinoglycan biosynthesis transport protein ExoP